MGAARRHVPHPDLPVLARSRRVRRTREQHAPRARQGRAGARRQRRPRWSAGCASGEEPYSLRLAWTLCAEPAFPDVRIDIVATDVDETLLARARRGLYRPSSLRDLPCSLAERAFRRSGDLFELRPEPRRDIAFSRQDIRTEAPDAKFDLALWRNLVFTYFDAPTQSRLLDELRAHMRPGGALVIGAHEKLPMSALGGAAWRGAPPICRLSGMHRPPRSD